MDRLAFQRLLILAVAASAGLWLLRGHLRSLPSPAAPGAAPVARGTGGGLDDAQRLQLAALEAEERRVEDQFWAKELVAQRCGRVVEQLWEQINGATNKLLALGQTGFAELRIGMAPDPGAAPLGHGVRVEPLTGPGRALSREEWRDWLVARQREGWVLEGVEFRHRRFELTENGRSGRSTFYAWARLMRADGEARATLEGDVMVEWEIDTTSAAPPAMRAVDAKRLTLTTGSGPALFRPAFSTTLDPPPRSFFIDPLVLYDLDGDGLDEVILAAKNVVLKLQPDGQMQAGPLCREGLGLIFTGLIADMDGDGHADFLCARFQGLFLYRGNGSGVFEGAGEQVWAADPRLRYGQALTCGDIDGDGDLDVWLGQYRVPFEQGQMPAPYYDANDGNPSYLLLNAGKGKLGDVTAQAGLAAKRSRRVYSASFADLDHDADLDLLVVSDFAGVDVYANDGRGQFTDVTREWIPEAGAFGMAHALADFDADGGQDLLVIGMNSPTAERLDGMGLWRPADDGVRQMRARMTFGNRVFAGRAGAGFGTSPLNASIARSGWSWGCTVLDADNDRFPDVYVANGHETRVSVQDYDSEFWLHDIYVGTSRPDPIASAYFQGKFSRTRGRGQSYGGHERNRFYWNQKAREFVEAGHLFGVALSADSRNVVANDLDADGRMDLLVTTFEVWPEMKQTLQVFRNEVPHSGHWIGIRLREQGAGVSPVGATVTVHTGAGVWSRQLITGDSYRSQHAAVAHFGLGDVERVEAVEVRWVGGRRVRIVEPAVDRYYDVRFDP
jgi:hypothetical protein